MKRKWTLEEPLLIGNYELLRKAGIVDLIDNLQIANNRLENLLEDTYQIARKASIEELINYLIKCLSDKFVPVNLIFILNQGILFNKIKILEYRNLQRIESNLVVSSLEPYEKFFGEHPGPISFSLFEKEIEDESVISSLSEYYPEMIVPIMGISGLYGIILIGRKILGQKYTDNEIEYINHLLRFTALGIQNNIHYQHSVRDAKTGLYNHSFFIRRVSEEISRQRRTEKPFAILMLDIDFFKKFNDLYGHLAGDAIILKLAKLLKQVLRDEDILSRFGGEEFTILLPHSDKESAMFTAERIRQKIESMETDWGDKKLKITASFGVALCNDNCGDAEELLKTVDAALYLSKTRGRNICSCMD